MMKKLFTLLLTILCAVVLNAQISGSGNGFMETFDYPDGTVYDDVTYEGVYIEWPADVGASVEGGVLEWEQDVAGEASFGGEFEQALDLTGYEDLTFKYLFPVLTEVAIYLADSDGGEGEVVPTNLILGTTTLQEATIDLSSVEGLDITKLVAFYIIAWTPTAGACAIDDIFIGDASANDIMDLSDLANNLLIYPNPSSSEISVNIDAQKISIINSIGQEVMKVENYMKGSAINISNLRTGVYFVKVDDYTQRILIQ
jgi:hypothetical protein